MIVDKPKIIRSELKKKEIKRSECVCINPVVKERSFNEDLELDYDKIGHKYYHNGELLDGVTDYLHRFYGEFNEDMICKSLSKLWGISPQEISDIWTSSGKVASEFGTAVHDALEHYEKYKEVGAKIAKARQQDPITDNYALPKHPVLRDIVLKFIEINKIEGKVLTEVLLTDVELGLAGRADRIVIVDQEKKICRIGDYKINIDAEKKESKYKAKGFETYPNNKIFKYQLQLSIYANMLQKQGLTVIGLDIYVYEYGWSYHPLEVLKIIN